MRVTETNGNGIGNNQNGSSNAIFVAVLPSLLLILNKKEKDIYKGIGGRIGKGRENDGNVNNVNNTPSEPSFPTRPRRSDEMTMEALEKLYELACERGCAKAARAAEKERSDFAACEECIDAALEEAAGLFKEAGKRLMPEGMEWPAFDDGEKVRIGDRVQLCNGRSEELRQVRMGESGYSLHTEASDEEHLYGTTVNRPEPADTQERIDADAAKTPCEYFGRKGRQCFDGDGCPSLETDGSCDAAKTRDLLRRQRELCAKGAGRC